MVLERLLWRVTCPNHASFFTLDSCQKRFLWTQKEVDVAPHPVVGLVLQVGDMEKFPHVHMVLKAWIIFSKSETKVCVSQP